MAGNNSIQILRGNNVKSTAADKILLDGQPLYDRTTGYLYVGEGNTVANTQAVNAHYANSAGSASSATTAQQANYVKGYLYFNGSGRNASWNGSDNEVVYAPTSLGRVGRVWGIASNGNAAWITQTEIPGTIEHANTANVAYEVSGSNVSGSVANANYSNVAGKVGNRLSLRVAGKGYVFDGSSYVNITDRNLVASTNTTPIGAIPYASKSGSGTNPTNVAWLEKGNDGQVLTATSTGIAWQTLNTSSLPSYIATIDVSYVDLPITASTYMITRVIGANGSIHVVTSSEGYFFELGNNSLIILGIRPGTNQITISYSNGNAVFFTANYSMTGIDVSAPPNTRYVVTKLSDD